MLGQWLDAGAELGNRTWSHPDINTMTLAEYEAGVLRADADLRAFLKRRGGALRYFRHPFLHAGKNAETKQALEAFLAAHRYTVAPVTLDNSDYMFAAVYGSALDRGDADLARRVREAYLPTWIRFCPSSSSARWKWWAARSRRSC